MDGTCTNIYNYINIKPNVSPETCQCLLCKTKFEENENTEEQRRNPDDFLTLTALASRFFRGKNPNEAQLKPLIALLLANADRFPSTSPKVELLLLLGAWAVICESKGLGDCPLDMACKLVLKTWRHFLKVSQELKRSWLWKELNSHRQKAAGRCLPMSSEASRYLCR